MENNIDYISLTLGIMSFFASMAALFIAFRKKKHNQR